MNFFKTITQAQWITLVALPLLVFVADTVVPAGPLHDLIMTIVIALGGQSLVSNRRPSTQGGTTTPAASLTLQGNPTTPDIAQRSAKVDAPFVEPPAKKTGK